MRTTPPNLGLAPAIAGAKGPLLLTITLLAAGSSIAALLLHAAGWVRMPYTISFVTLPGTIMLISLIAWASRTRRLPLLNRLMVGTAAGLIATAAYDIGRWALVEIFAIGFDPFGPIVSFGVLITGHGMTSWQSITAGWLYHISNGWTFGITYAVIAGSAAWWWGVAWGMALEFATVVVYPALFSISAYEPFLMVSLAGHFLYGGVLGLWCRRYAQGGSW